VKRFWQGEHDDVEAKLRKYRPEPRQAFLASLGANLHERMRRPRVARRAALVTGVTVGMLTVFAAFGGIGYASSAAGHAMHVSNIERLVGITQNGQSAQVSVNVSSSSRSEFRSNSRRAHENDDNDNDDDNNESDDEYRPGKGCGDKNHVHSRHNECKKQHHNHSGDDD
jgi:hypothetical protein